MSRAAAAQSSCRRRLAEHEIVQKWGVPRWPFWPLFPRANDWQYWQRRVFGLPERGKSMSAICQQALYGSTVYQRLTTSKSRVSPQDSPRNSVSAVFARTVCIDRSNALARHFRALLGVFMVYFGSEFFLVTLIPIRNGLRPLRAAPSSPTLHLCMQSGPRLEIKARLYKLGIW